MVDEQGRVEGGGLYPSDWLFLKIAPLSDVLHVEAVQTRDEDRKSLRLDFLLFTFVLKNV